MKWEQKKNIFSIVWSSVGPNSKFWPNTEYRICSGFENGPNTEYRLYSGFENGPNTNTEYIRFWKFSENQMLNYSFFKIGPNTEYE